MAPGNLLNRRTFLAGTVSASALVNGAPAVAADKPASLVYSTYGGDYGQWIKESFEDPFTAKTGIRLVHDIGENPQRYAKLKTYRERPRFQLIGLQDRYMHESSRDGLLEQIDYSKVPNAQGIPHAYKKRDWLAYTITYIGLIYNADRVKEAPRTWSDLLNDQFKGRIFLDDFGHFGLHCTVAAALANGGSYENIMPGLKLMQEIKERLAPRFISTSQEGMKLLGNGEVDVAMWQKSRADLLKRQGKPIRYVVPDTGDVAVPYGNAIVKGAGATEWGLEFLDFTADPALQGRFASGPLPSTATHSRASYSPEVAALIARPAGAKEFELNYDEVLPRLDDWTKLWNKMIGS